MIRDPWLDFRLGRFAAVGASNTMAGLAIIYACKFLLELGDIPSNFIGYGAGLLIGFGLNRNWTFGHRGDAIGALGRYLLVVLAAYAANLAATLYAIDVLNLNSYLAQAMGVLPYACVGYIGSRVYAFAPGR
jgi:putative flippase GtrA